LPPASHPNGGGPHGAASTGAPVSERPAVFPLTIVTLDEFVGVDEPGASALVGTADAVLIPEGGDIMFYGDGGAGKTTLAVDLACHLAAGDPWLGMPVTGKSCVLLIENEGPRPLFRAKLRRKRDAWQGSALEDRVRVYEEPWTRFSFEDPAKREALAATIAELKVDAVIVGPVTRVGMNEAGTLQEVRDFMLLIAECRRVAGRAVTFVLIHHENKAGQVSGAFEGAGDTLFHVQGQGHGRTRLYVQKARWASSYHATSLQLLWTDGDGFAVEEKPELDDEGLAEKILAFIAERPGATWTKVEDATQGVAKERRRDVRDGLLASGRILNVVKEDGVDVALDHCPERRPARLYLADDPAVGHLRWERGAGAAQAAPTRGANDQLPSAPCVRPLRGAGVGAAVTPPADDGLEWR
jgi:hypothetical protein